MHLNFSMNSPTMKNSYTNFRKKLYCQILKVENCIQEKRIPDEAEIELKHCFSTAEQLQKIKDPTDQIQTREFSFDLLKVVKLETELKNLRSGVSATDLIILEDYENQVYREEVIIAEVRNLLKSTSFPINVDLIRSLFHKLRPSEMKDVLQMELYIKDVVNKVPNTAQVKLSMPQLEMFLRSCHQVSMEKKQNICSWMMDVKKWNVSDMEREQILSSLLVVLSTDNLQLSCEIIQEYVKLVVVDAADSTWKYADVVLHLGDKVIASSNDLDVDVIDKTLSVLLLLASFFDYNDYYSHFLESFLIFLLHSEKLYEFDRYIETLKKSVLETSGVRKILILRLLLSGDYTKAVNHLSSYLSVEDGPFSVVEVFSWLNVLLPNLLTRNQMEQKQLEIFLETLAHRKFYHCWSFLSMTIELSVKFNLVTFVGDLVFEDSAINWAQSMDDDWKVGRLLWNAALGSSEHFTKYVFIVLAGYLLSSSQDDEIRVHTLMASLPAGLEVIRGADREERKQRIFKSIVNVFNYLKNLNLRRKERRILVNFELQLSVISNFQFVCDASRILSDLSQDYLGLLVFAVTILSDPALRERFLEQAAEALMASIKMEEDGDNKQLMVVGVTELLSSNPSSKSSAKLFETLKQIQWRHKDLMVEAMKLCWNAWAKVSTETTLRSSWKPWSRMFTYLHNHLTDFNQHIVGDLTKPTVELLQTVTTLVHEVESTL